MKWTDAEINVCSAEFARIEQESIETVFRRIRDQTIDECCKAVCRLCRQENDGPDHSMACCTIRDHFRESVTVEKAKNEQACRGVLEEHHGAHVVQDAPPEA